MAKDVWQEYIKEAKRIKVPVRSLLMQKKKMMRRLKNGLMVIPQPSRPDTFPSKPPGAYKLFVREKRGEVQALSEIMELWQKLDSEDKQQYIEKAQELERAFEEEMRKFKMSDEGGRYFREVKAVSRRN